MVHNSSSSNLILASASPRRKHLLEQVHLIPNQIIPADIDESPMVAEKPKPYVKRMAIEKANAISVKGFILAADTIVVQGGKIIGKPIDEKEARRMLSRLSGCSHQVITGVALKMPNGDLRHRIVTSKVKLKRLTPKDLNEYIQSNEWQGKAGAYAIQGLAEKFVIRIQGSFSNIVGLPLYETLSLLEGCGYPIPQQPS